MSTMTNAGRLAMGNGYLDGTTMYLMLMSGTPANAVTNTTSGDWTALEANLFSGYSRQQINNKFDNGTAVGSAVDFKNSTEVRISSTGAGADPVRAYAFVDSASGTITTVHAFGWFDSDQNPANGEDFVIPVNGLIFRFG